MPAPNNVSYKIDSATCHEDIGQAVCEVIAVRDALRQGCIAPEDSGIARKHDPASAAVDLAIDVENLFCGFALISARNLPTGFVEKMKFDLVIIFKNTQNSTLTATQMEHIVMFDYRALPRMTIALLTIAAEWLCRQALQ